MPIDMDTYRTLDGRIQNFAALLSRTNWYRLLCSFARHDRAFASEMRVHSHVRIHPRRNRHRFIAHWTCKKSANIDSNLDTGHTVRHNTVMFALIVLRTGMGLNHKMFLTEGVLAVLTFERQKVNETARLV
jgi:hypothetical protein